MSAAVDHWVAAFAPRGGTEPEWLGTSRGAALRRLRDQGFPTRREEAWKYTNPERIAGVAYRPAPLAELDADVLSSLALVPPLQDGGRRAVFVNGRLHRGASRLDALPVGLRCDVIGASASSPYPGEALESPPALAQRPFASLGDAFFDDGILVRAETGAQIAEPVDLVFLSAGDGGEPAASHPRVWVRAGARSTLAVREIYLSLDDSEHLTNAVCDYRAAEGSALTRTSVQAESGSATFLSNVAMRGERDAQLSHRAVALGAALAREDLVCELAGPGAACDLRGLYLTGDGQHSDHHTTVDHLEPHCSSDQLYRGVLGGRSRGAFTGTVVVRPHAQRADARQKNESLLLTERAEADSKPQLEIYADDVKCSHGSTIGQLDPDQIFYLRSRGVGEDEARGILIRGFAAEISAALGDETLRTAVDEAIATRLQEGTTW